MSCWFWGTFWACLPPTFCFCKLYLSYPSSPPLSWVLSMMELFYINSYPEFFLEWPLNITWSEESSVLRWVSPNLADVTKLYSSCVVLLLIDLIIAEFSSYFTILEDIFSINFTLSLSVRFYFDFFFFTEDAYVNGLVLLLPWSISSLTVYVMDTSSGRARNLELNSALFRDFFSLW